MMGSPPGDVAEESVCVNLQPETGAALVEAHLRATRNLRIVSLIFPALFMALIVWNLAAIARMFRDIDGPAVGTELSNRMNVLMPDVDDTLSDVAGAVQPALASALQTESAELAPQIEGRLQADVEHTMAKAKGELQADIDSALQDADERHRAKLVERFPELANDVAAQDAALAALRDVAREWGATQLDALVAEHLQAMENLHRTLQKSYTRPEGTSADPEDALMALLDLMNEHVGGGEEILADDGKAAGVGAKTKRGAAAGKE